MFTANGAGPVFINEFKLSPDPMQIPGTIHVFMNGQTLATIGEHSVSITIVKRGILDLRVPCIDNIGSW